MDKAFGLEIPQTLEDATRPDRLALVVYDMQVGIMSQLPYAGVATEIGIEPTVRSGADLGFIPIVIEDACGAGDQEAGERALASMRFMGDAFVTDSASFKAALAATG